MRLLFLLIFPISLFAEVVLTSQKTRLYAINGTVLKSLEKDLRLEVDLYARDKKYYQIKNTQNLILVADTIGFEQMLNNSEKKKLSLENAFKSRQRELLRIKSELKTMEIQILETQRDTALSYQSSYRSGGRYTYSYTRLISTTKARKVIESLNEEKEKLKLEQNKIFRESMNISAALGENQVNIERLSKLFTGADKNHNKYIITKKDAPVFLGSQTFTHLKLGELVTARAHPKHRNFHQVIINKKIYTIASTDLANLNGLKLDYNKRITSNLSGIEFQKRIVDDLQTSTILLQSIMRQLTVDKAISGYVKVKNMRVQIDPNTVLIINNQNGDSVYVHSNRAKNVIEDWSLSLADKKLKLKIAEANLLERQKFNVDLRQEQSEVLALLQ